MSIFSFMFPSLSTWRIYVPSAVGIGAGLGIYHLSGKDPSGAAVAFALGLAGVCIGVIWELSQGRDDD
jgi:hypothetical protein